MFKCLLFFFIGNRYNWNSSEMNCTRFRKKTTTKTKITITKHVRLNQKKQCHSNLHSSSSSISRSEVDIYLLLDCWGWSIFYIYIHCTELYWNSKCLYRLYCVFIYCYIVNKTSILLIIILKLSDIELWLANIINLSSIIMPHHIIPYKRITQVYNKKAV